MTEARGRPIFLVGFMGSGKSSLGPRLAQRLGWTFVDTDARIEEREGKSITAIFRDSGEPHFRRIEAQVLAEAASPERVIAAGGGSFLAATNRRWMHQTGCTVWLDLSLERVRQRLGRGQVRPLWNPADPLSQRILYERRRAVYALAAMRIDVAEASVQTLVERIQKEIQ